MRVQLVMALLLGMVAGSGAASAQGSCGGDTPLTYSFSNYCAQPVWIGARAKSPTTAYPPQGGNWAVAAYCTANDECASHLCDHGRVAIFQLGKALLEQQCIFSHSIEKLWIGHDVEHGITDRHCERIAAEGRAVRPDSHPLGSFRRRKACADRETAAKRLRNRHDVGLNSAALVGEHFA